MWGAIWVGGRSRLQVLNANVTGAVYCNILQTFLDTSNPPANFRFQDDNAPAHRARCVTTFKEARGIVSLPWPSRSPDLNPIEHLWDMLSRRLVEQPPENLAQLRERLLQEWDAIPQAVVDNLIHSMTRRVAAVIAANGGNTRY
jgi:transposase